MQFSRLKTVTAILAAAVGVTAFAGSAQAAIVDNYGFDTWGDPDLTLNDANMAYDWQHSTITGHLTGTLNVHRDGNNARFRVALKSYDIGNVQIGATVYDDAKGTLVQTNGAKPIPVDVTTAAAPNVAYVQVDLQKQVAGGPFVTKDYYNVTVLTHSDDVTILGSGIDVGGSGFAAHAPTGPASVWWKIQGDGELTANFSGTLHLDRNFWPGRGRIVIRALNNAGKVLATDVGDECKPKDIGYLACAYTLSVTTADAIRLNVQMQTSDGSTNPKTGETVWLDDGGQTVSVAE